MIDDLVERRTHKVNSGVLLGQLHVRKIENFFLSHIIEAEVFLLRYLVTCFSHLVVENAYKFIC